MALYTLDPLPDLVDPVVIVAFDGWVDAGSAATQAAGKIAEPAVVVGRFDPDQLYDYRARRPNLVILDGRPAELKWPELTIRRRRIGERDALLIVGPEPDDRWRAVCDAAVEIADRLGVAQWISLGAIPAAVPHTRPVPVMGTESRTGLLHEDVKPGPSGILRVPAACLSAVDHAVSEAGVPAVGYFAQIPHYVSGEYPIAAVELVRVIGRHLGADLQATSLAEEGKLLRKRLDEAAASDEQTREYVERLESTVDDERLPSGGELIADIERFLREGGTRGSGG